MTPLWITIMSSLLSGLIGVILSSWFYLRYEHRKQKFDTLRRLLGNRFSLPEAEKNNFEHSREEFFAALNEIVVVFHDSPIALDALNKYYENKSLDNLVRLFKAICKSLKVSYEFNDSFFQRPFTPVSKSKENNK